MADPGREDEVVVRLARVGYDHPIGFLEGGFASWLKAGEEVDTLQELSPEELDKAFDGKNMKVLDVRKHSEYTAEHVIGASNFPLDFINRNMNDLKPENKYFLYCATGYRSVIAGSILKARGIQDVVNIPGGFTELMETNISRTEFTEQETEL